MLAMETDELRLSCLQEVSICCVSGIPTYIGQRRSKVQIARRSISVPRRFPGIRIEV